MFKRLKLLTNLLLVAGLCGCFKVKDELSLQPDGSGTVRIETETGVDLEAMGMSSAMMSRGGEDRAQYPPANQSEARTFFAGPDFQITAKEESITGGGKRSVVTASFKNINSLLASRYAKAHQLALKIENGRLVFKGKSGAEMLARYAAMIPDRNTQGFMTSAMGDARKKTNEMRAEFRVTLPGAATSATGKAEGNSATWIVEHAKCTNTTEFATQLGQVLEASCSAEGLKFVPTNPARLGLLPFPELAEGDAGQAGQAPDAQKIIAAAKFVPHTLTVTRAISLGGNGGGRESQAVLSGVVVVPKELAPPKWGQTKLLEATDSKGNSLMPEKGNEFGRSYRSFDTPGMFGEDDSEEPGAKPKEVTEVKRTVQLQFRAPDWKVKQINRVKGVLPLEYPGAAQVIKVAQAIPEKWIVDPTKGNHSFGMDEMEQRKIEHPKLGAAGLKLSISSVNSYSGMTMIMLSSQGKSSALSDGQVFDADGRPWPTIIQQQDDSASHYCTLMVVGRPKPPLSLALLVNSISASVEVPLVVERVSVEDR